MKMQYVTIAAAALAATLCASPAEAQIQVGTKVGEPAPVMAGRYDSLGRRDPFVSLIAPRRAPTGAPSAPRASRGLGSLILADITVTGVSRKGDVWMALVQGADRQSYVIKVRDKIADASVKAIDAQGVVFVDVSHPGSTARPQETRKLLRSAAEVIR